jgi:hypothetical protein
MSTQSQIAVGQLTPWSTWGKFNNIAFAIQQLLSKIQTATLVEVISCTNAGGLSPVGTVNIKPCVNQVDSAGNAYPHTTIFNVPYFRLFGGNNGNAIVLDPQPGDIGIAVFASRDISSVKNNQAAANPASARQYDFSDALYLGGVLNGGTPSQYIRFSSDGIEIVSPQKVTIQAPEIDVQGSSKITLQAPEIDLKGVVNQTDGTMTVETDLLAGPTSISSVNHTHISGSPGSPTGPPLP